MFSSIKEKDPRLFRFIIGILILTIIASGFVSIRVFYRRTLSYAFLIWNIFLAWVPFLFSLVLTNSKIKNRVAKYIVGFFWLMFYPNAPYIVTDFIHLSSYNFYKSGEYAFNISYRIWYDFFLISIFVIIGLALAYSSLRLIHDSIKGSYGSFIGWVFVVTVSVLSGYAIYLGRFVRVNSWEVVTRPFKLVEILLGNISLRGGLYSITFGVMILFIYAAFTLVGEFNREKSY